MQRRLSYVISVTLLILCSVVLTIWTIPNRTSSYPDNQIDTETSNPPIHAFKLYTEFDLTPDDFEEPILEVIKTVPITNPLEEPQQPEIIEEATETGTTVFSPNSYKEFNPDLMCFVSDYTNFFYYDCYIDQRYYNLEVPIKLSIGWQRYLYSLCEKYEIEYELTLALMIYESAGADVYLGLDKESGYTVPAINPKTGKYCTHVGIGSLSVYYNREYFLTLGIDILTPEGSMEAAVIAFASKYHNATASTELHRLHRALIAYNDGDGGLQTLVAKGKWKTAYSSRVLQIREGLLQYANK